MLAGVPCRTGWLTPAVAVSAALAVPAQGRASAQVIDPIQYQLQTGSVLAWGCMGPCACPVLFSDPVKGPFTFYRRGVDPLYEYYELLNINWTYSVGNPSSGGLRDVHVTGTGTYQIGGEFALMQRMTLLVTSADTLLQYYDSGLVPVEAPFPAISIDVHARQNVCLDSVFHVVAGPPGTGSILPGSEGRLLRNALGNPTRGPVEVFFAPPTTSVVSVQVFDVRGRVVANLLDGVVDAGRYVLRWDGRDLSGVTTGPGVYWVRAQAGDRIERERIVRLN